MEISQLAQTSVPTAQSAASSVADISSDFETFLKMLTVQLENQDPLNPVDSADYAVQLATFSGVEQQVQTNELLRDLVSQMGASGLTQIAGWVGMEARAATPAVFDGAPLTLAPDVATGATAAEIVVRNESGSVVQQFTISPTDQSITWAGVGADNAPLPPGLYRFETVSFDGDAELERRAAEVYSRVTEVQNDNGAATLILAGGARVTASDITALRER